MPQLFTNNARALLTSGISASDTSMVVESAKADLFPTANTGTGSVPAATNWFKVTLQDSSGNVEIVYVRTRSAGSGVMSNLLRAQEGTTARAFTAGTVVGLRVTAADVQTALAIPEQNNYFSGTNTFAGSTTFISSPGVPTAAFGASDTRAASTAFVQAALQAVYPVGSVYINADNDTNPATLLGFGTWAEIGAGRVLVGQNVVDSSFDTLGETGGSKDATVVAHSHTASTSTAGEHTHTLAYDNRYLSSDCCSYRYPTEINQPWSAPMNAVNPAGAHTHSVTVNTTGSSGTNANLQPYLVVKMWKRTA